jgi:CheY-like chemotaxis protein
MTQVQPNILIVEDDFISQEVLKAMLSCYPLTVYCASDGAQALAQASQRVFALLLLDQQLPDTTGIALYQQLVALQPQAQAALVSSHHASHLNNQAKAAGIQQVLSKPLEPHQLADLLRITGCI